jgi:hypothetical protein
MTTLCYENALAEIDKSLHITIETALKQVALTQQSGRIFANVQTETALQNRDFVSLLSTFNSHLTGGCNAEEAWLRSCRAHKFKGKTLTSFTPRFLARVKSVDDHAISIARSTLGTSIGLTAQLSKKRLKQFSEKLPDVISEKLFRSAMLGDFLIWATFEASDITSLPLVSIPHDRPSLLTALGLGLLDTKTDIMLLTWDHQASGSPELYRPTVADAENYSYFLPCQDATSAWGFTCPLRPNPTGLCGQPEVVLKPIDSSSLIFPFKIIST